MSQENCATHPAKGLVAPTFQLFKGVSRFKLPLGRVQGGNYTVACRAAMGHLDHKQLGFRPAVELLGSPAYSPVTLGTGCHAPLAVSSGP